MEPGKTGDSALVAWGAGWVKGIWALFLAVSVSYLVPLFALAESSEPGQLLFETKCQVCHTIGQGRQVGPDLRSVTTRRERAWLIDFIVSPNQLIAGGDPIAAELVREYGLPMPNLGVSRQEAEAILAYIQTQSGVAPPSAGPSAPTIAGNAALGKDLFTGQAPFKNGGAACASCHDLTGLEGWGGGTLARDLTATYSQMGEGGLRSFIKAAPIPAMRTVFGDRPLTDEEVAHLVAFLGQGGRGEATTTSAALFALVGLAGFVLVLVAIHFIWVGRLGGVRQPLVRGAGQPLGGESR